MFPNFSLLEVDNRTYATIHLTDRTLQLYLTNFVNLLVTPVNLLAFYLIVTKSKKEQKLYKYTLLSSHVFFYIANVFYGSIANVVLLFPFPAICMIGPLKNVMSSFWSSVGARFGSLLNSHFPANLDIPVCCFCLSDFHNPTGQVENSGSKRREVRCKEYFELFAPRPIHSVLRFDVHLLFGLPLPLHLLASFCSLDQCIQHKTSPNGVCWGSESCDKDQALVLVSKITWDSFIRNASFSSSQLIWRLSTTQAFTWISVRTIRRPSLSCYLYWSSQDYQ